MVSSLSSDIFVDTWANNEYTKNDSQPSVKKQKLDHSRSSPTTSKNDNNEATQAMNEIDQLFNEINASIPSPNDNEEGKLDDEINRVLSTFNDFNDNITIQQPHPQSSFPQQFHNLLDPITSEASINNTGTDTETGGEEDGRSPFDSVLDGTAQTEESNISSITEHEQTKINPHTVMAIKQSMINNSKLISLFTTLRMTYLKLCKEFNYLLNKFKENETIKIELIHENNELRKLLTEIIKDREIERKQFKATIQSLEKSKSVVVS